MSASPIVLYDGACGFCRACLAVVLRWDRERRLHPIEIQSADGDRLLADVAPADRLRSAHLITPNGVVLSGARAAPALFRELRFGTPLAVLCAVAMPLVAAAYYVLTRVRGPVGRRLPSAWCARADRLIANRRRGIVPPTIARYSAYAGPRTAQQRRSSS